MEKLIEILKETVEDCDFENEKALIDNEIITSLELTEIILEIEDTFGVSIGMDELTPENFNSAEAIWNLICRLKKD